MTPYLCEKLFNETDEIILTKLARFVKVIMGNFCYKSQKNNSVKLPSSPAYNPVLNTKSGRNVKRVEKLNL